MRGLMAAATVPCPEMMDSTDLDSSAFPLPTTHRRREAEDWSLVLSAEGIPNRVVREGRIFSIEVLVESRGEEAIRILDAWQLERAERDRRIEPPPARSATALEMAMAYAMALSLLAFHLGLDLSGRHESFVESGASRAEIVLAGDLERLVTALTLHSDLPHVLGNTLFGGFFLATLAGRLGIGLAALGFVVTGTLGNLANALYYGVDHGSIGASTGVFGLVGILTGLAAWQRHQRGIPGRGGWVALGAGLGILAMLGTGGPRVDLSAHLFGLAAGALAGLLLAIPLASRPPPPRLVQALAFSVALGLVFGAWEMTALRG